MGSEVVWHPEVLSPEVRATIEQLSVQRALDRFYLAGGTALALQWGHRTSVDLAFFMSDTMNEDLLLGSLQELPEITVISKAPETLHLHVGATKVSFLAYHYPVLFPLNKYLDVSVADPRDIGAMKLSAIAARGTKRDFVDLYVLSERYGLVELVNVFEQKFVQAGYNRVHVLKSLTYFADADKEPMPHMLQQFAWKEVQTFFVSQAPGLRKRR